MRSPIVVTQPELPRLTALIASLAVARPEGLAIAFVHLLFNIAGTLLLYPVPAVRVIPLKLATWLSDIASRKHRIVVIWLLTSFIILPLMGVFLFQ